jgi:O-methyltransferase
MDNFFITREFDWKVRRSSHVDRALNLVTRRVGYNSNTAEFVDDMIHRLSGLRLSPTWSGRSTTVEQRINMYHLVAQALAYAVEGDLVEVGCNEGQSSVLIAHVLRELGSTKTLHVYDSFEGLPESGGEDGGAYRKGDLTTSQDVLIGNFTARGLEPPVIHKGWFQDTLPHGLPEAICFAYLDGDFYESILVSLRHVYPRLSPGAVCLVDDYCDPGVDPEGWNWLPGVKRACDEFLADKPEEMCCLYSGAFSHAYFRKH